MRLLKQVGTLVLLGAVAGGGYYGWEAYGLTKVVDAKASAPRGGERAVSVETELAGFRDLKVIVEAVGSTLALRSVDITPLAAGRVTKVSFASGDLVKAGAELLRLDEVIQQADLVEAEARLTEASHMLRRSETLKKQHATSEASFDNLTAKVAIAKADQARAAKRLRDRVVTAPFSGVVGFSSVEPGARVDVNDVVTVLDDLTSIKVEFSLPESLFGTVGLGKHVIAHAAPFPDRAFDGAIDSVDSRIDPVSRSFKARAIIANDDRALAAGMFVHLAVVLDAEKALAVPEEAVVADGSRPYLFVVEKSDKAQRISRRYISTGRRSFGYVEITEGVADGEPVVVRGIQKVRDGSMVKTKDQSGPAGSKDPSEPAKKRGGAKPS
ncbi:MAG: efflux RND transporter periplasmic adaptor subunit [Rhodospirillales bacterium]|nr:efflux RND transporter periplasmic adaptor subunit [Rhodospirillales bacterium]